MGRLICPDKVRVKLVYTTGINITSAGTAGGYVFSGNSIFDPDVTGSGNQPIGFDEWSAFYTTYRVLASKFIVQARSNLTTNMSALTIIPKDNATVELDYQDVAAEPYAKTRFLPNQGAGYPTKLQNYCTTRKIKGLTSKQVADASYSAAVTGNPAERWYWHLYVDDITSGAVNQSVYCFVKIVYYVEFFQRQSLDRS